jgi:PAS domain S-box-containing protein
VAADEGDRRVTGSPSFEDIFAVMSAASVGDLSARVTVPSSASLDAAATRFALGLNVLLDDLTARQDDLRRSQARFTALYEAGTIGILVARLDGRVLEINDALVDALGYSRDDLLTGSVDWSALTPPEWRDADRRAAGTLKTTGAAALREKEYLRKDGSRLPVMVGSTLLPGTQDETISIVLDLRTNKQAAIAVEHLREVRASEAMFRGLLEAAPDAVVIVGGDGRLVLVNS